VCGGEDKGVPDDEVAHGVQEMDPNLVVLLVLLLLVLLLVLLLFICCLFVVDGE
jgi:hypothetical protein